MGRSWHVAVLSAPREMVAGMPGDDLPATGADTLRRGLRVLVRGIGGEPRMFALAVAGSALYGAGTAGSGWLLGRLTQTVLAPAFAPGQVTGGQLAVATGSLAAVA